MVPNGFYKVSYDGKTGSGFGLLAFFNGTICGLDEAGVRYDGSYGEDDLTGAVQMHVTVLVPVGVALVIGTPARDDEWSFAVDAALPPGFTSGSPVKLRTRFGVVNVVFTLMRAFDPATPEIDT